ncbi:MAG TPA: tRNA lysidine(34) synthetase TilS [Candidatus Angelobacter sp.]|jgi:tRNA(Ile)-lysidine synthase|nr:tRNA lysidine(34) synthetase TilS [Candidatus Angelobacter sp.]
MLNEEKLFREIKKIFPLGKKILVAVSGGIDSMSLLNILLKLRIPFGVVHANFQLRGDFSNKDETFVTYFCLKRNIPLYKKRFNVLEKKNMQISARVLRYDWFEQLLNTKSYDFLALGHHLDDSIENFFLNLIRGTGIKGFLGIPKKRKQYIRPLLPFTKSEIISFAKKHDISWREDSSNSKNEYFRNIVRHDLVPVFKKLSINFYKNFQKTINFLNETFHLENEYFQKISSEITEVKTFHPFFWKIHCKKLKKIHTLTTCLFKLFSPYGFVNITDMIRLLNAQSGKQIFSRKYRILKDRNYWILLPRIRNIEQKVYKIIDLLPKKTPFSLYFSFNQKIESSADAALDLYKLQWPLQLRTWKKGDYFYPLGTNFKKKLSKYFKDEKLSLFEKDHIWILTNAYNDIVWIVKRRLDDRFKVTEKTKHVLNIHLS